MALGRAMRGWASTLVSERYFTSWDSTRGVPGTLPEKLGLLSVDYPSVNTAVEHVLMPALKAAGHPVDPNNYVKLSNGNSTADAPRTVADIQNAVLRFQTNGVTHVLIFDNAGGVTLFFAQAAQNQHYYPRWGITTENALESWIESGNVTAQQANGAAGLGWEPNYDLSTKVTGPGTQWSTPTAAHCDKVLKAHGITSPSANAELIALEFCDRIYFLAHVMNHMDPKDVTRQELVRVIDGLGSSWVSASVQKTFFSASQHDGVTLGYALRYVASCTCMRYDGPPFPLS